MLATGKSVSEIGLILHLGVTTISTYRTRILTKMDMKTNADLVKYAILTEDSNKIRKASPFLFSPIRLIILLQPSSNGNYIYQVDKK
jgi:hypothetical protein